MPSTVKFRPDQPLFKADAFRMPLWVHAPFEMVRGFVKWLTVTLHRDNPHRNALDNATFTKSAKKPHRNAFWSGQPVVKGPKWRVMVWRWGLVFTVLASVKYMPGRVWLALARGLGNALKWIGLDVLPWMWAHLLWLPVIGVGTVVGLYGAKWVFKRGVMWVRDRRGLSPATPWYEYVIGVEDYAKGLVERVRNR